MPQLETGAQNAGGEPGFPQLEFEGRLFARFAYEKVEAATTSRGTRLNVPSARFGLTYRPSDWLRLVLEADIADSALTDGYIHVRRKPFWARAGQFKMPISSITLESPWRLPVARRGVIQDLLELHMQIVGRRPGAAVAWKGGGALDPELVLSVFQGVELDIGTNSVDTDPVRGANDAQTAVARFQVTPGGQEVAAAAQRTTTRVQGAVRHFWTLGVDATLEFPTGHGGFRAWIEAFLGRTWYFRTGPVEPFDATYAVARAIAAYRVGGVARGDAYIEPFLMLGGLNPDLETGSDLFVEGAVGVNLGCWKDARIGVSLELAKGQDGMPSQLFPTDQMAISDHLAVLIQAGAAF